MRNIEKGDMNTCMFFDALMGNLKENGVLILDSNGVVLECNEGFYNAYGYLEEDVIGQHFSFLFIEEDQKANRPQLELQKAIKFGSASDKNYLKHKDGFPIWTHGETIKASGEFGAYYFIKNIVDINEQKVLENYLQESELAETIFEKLNEPVVAVDKNLRIIKANSAFYENFDLDPSEEGVHDFFTTIEEILGNVSDLKKLMLDTLPESFTFEDFETEYDLPSKGRRVLNILVSRIEMGTDKLKRIILYFRDITKQKQEKEELERSIKFSQGVIETLPQITYTSEPEGAITYFNSRWEEYTGQPLEEGLGKGWLKMIHPEDIHLALKVNKETVQENKESEFDFRVFNASTGDFRWNIARIRPVINESGEITLWVNTITDIHEEKTASLNQIRNLQNILLESQKLGNVGSFDLDFNTDKILWSPQAYEIYGVEYGQEVYLEDIFLRVHPNDKEKLRNKIDDSVRNKTPYEIEYDIVLPDNCIKKLLARGKIIYDEKGDPQRLIGALIDITKRKKREEKLQNMQTLLLESQSLSHTGSFEWNLINNKVKWTPELYTICGIPHGEKITFETHNRYIHPEDFPSIQRQFDEVYVNPGPFENEFRIQRPDMSERFVSAKAKVVFNRDRKPIRVLGTLHDLTERKKIEEKLSQANLELEKKVKERTIELLHANEELKKANLDSNTFVYTASHDLKAPIGNIEGLLRVLKEEISDTVNSNANVKALFEMIDISVGNFKQNLQDLAAIGKAQAEGNLEESLIKFEDIYNTVINDLKDQIFRTSAKIKYDFAKAPEVTMSPKNLRSIFYNFLSNALKYRSPEREPQIKIFTDTVGEDYILLSIQDNGMGIKEEDQDRLFTMYKRIHEHVQGSGVGLAIVKRIIENNGGRIEVNSRLNEGTTFRIYIRK